MIPTQRKKTGKNIILRLFLCLQVIKKSMQAPTKATVASIIAKSSEFLYSSIPSTGTLTFISQTNLINTTRNFILVESPTSHYIAELHYSSLKLENQIEVQDVLRGRKQLKQISDTMLVLLSSFKQTSGVTSFKMMYFNPSNLGKYTSVLDTTFDVSPFTTGVDDPRITSYDVDDEFLVSFGKYLRKFLKKIDSGGLYKYEQVNQFIDTDLTDPLEHIHGVKKMKEYYVICEAYKKKMIRVWLTDNNLNQIYKATSPIFADEQVHAIQNGLDCFSEDLKTCVFAFNELNPSGIEIKSHLYFLIDIEYNKFHFGDNRFAIYTVIGYSLKAINIIKNTPFIFMVSENTSSNLLEVNLGVYSAKEESFFEKLDWALIENFQSMNNYNADSLVINPNPFSVYFSDGLSYQRYEVLTRNKGCFNEVKGCEGCNFIDNRCDECIFKMDGIYTCTQCVGDKQPVNNGLECGCADGKFYLKSTDQCIDCGSNVKKCNPHDNSVIECLATFIVAEDKTNCICPRFAKIDETVTPSRCECQRMADLMANVLQDYSNLCTCDIGNKPHIIIDSEDNCSCDPNYEMVTDKRTNKLFCNPVCNFQVGNVDVNQCRKCDNVEKTLCNCKGDYKEDAGKTKCEINCPPGLRVNDQTHLCESCPAGFRSNLEGTDCVPDDAKGLELTNSYFIFRRSLAVIQFNQNMLKPEKTVDFDPSSVQNGLFQQGLLLSLTSGDSELKVDYRIKKIEVSSEDSKSIEIEIYAKPSTPDMILTIYPKSEKGFLSKDKGGVYTSNINIAIPKNESFFDISEEQTQNIKDTKDVILPIASFLSFTSVVALAKVIQVLDYVLLIDVPLPPKVINFLSLMNSNILETFSISDVLIYPEDNLSCRTQGIWAEMEFSCYTWNNSGWNYVGILIILAIVIVFSISYGYRKRKRRKQVEPSDNESSENTTKLMDAFLDKLNEFFNVGLIFLVLDVFLLDIGVSLFLNLFTKFIGSVFEILNGVLSVVALFFYIYADYRSLRFVWLKYNLKRIKEEEEIEKKFPERFRKSGELKKEQMKNVEKTKKEIENWKFVSRELKDQNNLITLCFIPILITRDLIVSFCIVALQDYPKVQIIAILFPQVGALIFLSFQRPLRSTRELVFMIAREGFFCLTLFIFLYITMKDIKSFDGNQNLEIALIITIAGIVMTAVLMVIVNLLILIWAIIKLILKILCCFYCCFDKEEEDIFKIKAAESKRNRENGQNGKEAGPGDASGASMDDSQAFILSRNEDDRSPISKKWDISTQHSQKNKRKGVNISDLGSNSTDKKVNIFTGKKKENFDGGIKIRVMNFVPGDMGEEDDGFKSYILDG